MPDYGHKIQFGYFLYPDSRNPSGVLETAIYLEDLGYDYVAIQDHPYLGEQLDSFALMAMILGRTHRLRVLPHVVNLHVRNAALVANFAATLDHLSDGRFELGVGAGAPFLNRKAVGMGAPQRTAGDLVDAVSEGIDVIRALWSGDEKPAVNGRHFSLHDVTGGPVPSRKIDISIGALGLRMLELTAEKADGWVASGRRFKSPEELVESSKFIDQKARLAGRDPREIRRIYTVVGEFGADHPEVPSPLAPAFAGPPKHWATMIAQLATEHGFSTFLLNGEPEHNFLETYAREIIPHAREEIESKRATSQGR